MVMYRHSLPNSEGVVISVWYDRNAGSELI